MSKDFYLSERALASCFERDWFDHVISQGDRRALDFDYAQFAATELYCPFHSRLVEFLALQLQKLERRPTNLLEVGSSLGRTFYEVCRSIESVRSATLVEPSQNFFSYFQKLFNGAEVEGFAVLKGNGDMSEVQVRTGPIKAACGSVKFDVLNMPFQKIDRDLGRFDLVICANVIDQCHDPLQLVELLKSSTAPGGLLLIACTYQWQDKYLGNAGHRITDIGELFDSRWRHLDSTNLEFWSRVNERHWLKFLSHVCVFQMH